VSEFLTNLALRSAGMPAIVAPDPGIVWTDAPGLSAGDAESELEVEPQTRQPEPQPVIEPPSRRILQSSALDVGVEPRVPANLPPFPPTEPFALPEVTSVEREVTSARTEIPRRRTEPVPAIEIREVVRQTEVLRETVIERPPSTPESAETNPSKPEPPRVSPAPPGPSRVEPREVISATTARAAPVASPPVPVMPSREVAPIRLGEAAPRARLPEIFSPSSKSSSVVRPPDQNRGGEVSPIPDRQTVATESPSPVQRQSPSREVQRAEPPEVPPPTPRLSPAPPVPSLPLINDPPRRPPPADQRVEVTIGTIEFRAPPAATAAPVAEGPAPVTADPADGLDSYRALRRYTAWFRE
jgi:hypothetical protein